MLKLIYEYEYICNYHTLFSFFMLFTVYLDILVWQSLFLLRSINLHFLILFFISQNSLSKVYIYKYKLRASNFLDTHNF